MILQSDPRFDTRVTIKQRTYKCIHGCSLNTHSLTHTLDKSICDRWSTQPPPSDREKEEYDLYNVTFITS